MSRRKTVSKKVCKPASEREEVISVSTITQETTRQHVNSYSNVLKEFSRNPESMSQAVEDIGRQLSNFDWAPSSPTLQDTAKLQSYAVFLLEIVAAANTQGVAGT